MNRWINDPFPDLHNDDMLWALAIREYDSLFSITSGELKDPVLRRLIKMGLVDWRGEDKPLNQATRALRHSSSVGCRLLCRVLELEGKASVVEHISHPITNCLL